VIGIVVVSHGRLAEELCDAARHIIGGDVQALASVSIAWNQDADVVREMIERAIGSVQQGEGVLILTDMFGGTPTNLSLPFLTPQVEIVTGVNLPMLIKLIAKRQSASLAEIARLVCEQGKDAIYVASDLLERRV
jgi:PTS system mannose-specific IIA component